MQLLMIAPVMITFVIKYHTTTMLDPLSMINSDRCWDIDLLGYIQLPLGIGFVFSVQITISTTLIIHVPAKNVFRTTPVIVQTSKHNLHELGVEGIDLHTKINVQEYSRGMKLNEVYKKEPPLLWLR